MKNKKFIVIMIILIISIFSLISCKNYSLIYNLELEELIDAGKTSAANQSDKTKLTISTGNYNFSGDFRIMLDDEEIFNSEDYDYFVPKKTKIFSRVLPKLEYKSSSISIELLSKSAHLESNVNHNNYMGDTVTSTNYNTFKKMSYYVSNGADYYMFFVNNKVNKGNNYVLFKTDDYEDSSQFHGEHPSFYESLNDDIAFEDVYPHNYHHKDYSGNNYHYLIVNSRNNNYRLRNTDIFVHSRIKHIDVFLGISDGKEMDIRFKSMCEIFEIRFINTDDDIWKYYVKDYINYKSKKTMKNGKILVEDSDYKYYLEKNYNFFINAAYPNNHWSTDDSPYGVVSNRDYLEEYGREYEFNITIGWAV